MEEWKDIKGFNGFFQVSNLGNIRPADRSFTNKNGRRYSFSGKPLKQQSSKNGYKLSCFNFNGKLYRFLTHRLVYETFIGVLDERLVVDHINGNKTDNRASNLRQITSRENTTICRKRKHPVGCNSVNGKYYIASFGIGKSNRVYLGCFNSEKEAEKSYNDALVEYNNTGTITIRPKRKINKVINGMKVCSKCGINKSVSEYSLCNHGHPYSMCRSCVNKRKREKKCEIITKDKE